MLLISLAVILALSISTAQSLIGQKVGSDHPSHVFLTRRIRRNGFRLFVRIPDLLNDSYCAAVPLYIHWIIAHFKSRAVYWSERLLNPGVNSLHVVLFAGIALFAFRRAGLPDESAAGAACLFALTPQFYHALSARNMGLSARGTGLLMLTAFFFAAYAVEELHQPAVSWVSLVVFGWLVWGFSTFAQQAMCILSVLIGVFTGRWVPLAGTFFGLLLFVALHPKYSMGYLRHTILFIRAYAKELAPIYILERRKSIWRDLIWDIWLRFGTQRPAQAVRYAYENSVIVIVALNPLFAVCCWSALHGADLDHGFFGFSLSVALCGAAAAFLTSFRATRFLGEPERYVEAVTPWAVFVGAHVIFGRGGMSMLMLTAAAFLIVDVSQLIASNVLLKAVGDRAPELQDIERAIEDRWGENARVCSNNEQLTKMLMQHDWQYAYCLAVGQPYCGMSLAQAFSRYPVLRREACERIASRLRINACLLDRTEYETLFEQAPLALKSMRVGYESDRLRLLFLEWDCSDARLEPA